jgi:hypothetical protein
MAQKVFSEEANLLYLLNNLRLSAKNWISQPPWRIALAIQHANKPPSMRTKIVGCHGYPASLMIIKISIELVAYSDRS